MLALYILGGILLFLFLLTLLPVRMDVAFREEFALTVRYAFLRFPLLPGKEAPEGPAPEPAPEEKAGPGAAGRIKRALKREGFWGLVQALGEFIKEALMASGRLLTHLKLKRFDLYLCLGGAYDAAEAAILYGKLSAGVYGACGMLFSLMPCRKKGVTVDLDYSAAENTAGFSASLSIRPLFVLKAGLVVLWNALPLLRKLR